MRIVWFGVWDGKEWRAEYQLLRYLQAKGVMVVCVNNRAPTFDVEIAMLTHHADTDLYFLQNGKTFRPEWLSLFNKPVVYWASEASLSRSRHLLHAQRKPDYVIAHSMQTMNEARRLGIPCSRMHNAFDSKLYFRKPMPKRYDVCMIGCMTGRRKRWYFEMMKQLGRDTIVYVRNRYTAQQANEIYNQSKIILHVHAINETYLPSRLFEAIPTSGCLLIEDMKQNWDPALGEGFFVKFSDRADMIKKIRELKTNAALCDKIVNKANAIAVNHTWAQRADQLIKIFNRVVTDARTVRR